MKLRAIHITNFGPFVGRQTFKFPEDPGLYFLWGDNQEEPRLGSNGAGKSKLWDALIWVLFGKTSRGLRAGDVSSWDIGKGTKVELEVTTPSGEDVCIERTWSPNSWLLHRNEGLKPEDLTKAPNNPVLAWLALDFEPFLQSVLMAQTTPMFLDLKADAKAALFAKVMDLDQWLDRSAAASEKAKAQDRTCRQLEQRLASTEGKLQAVKGASVADEAEAWDEEHDKQILALADSYERTIDAAADLRDSLPQLERMVEAAKAAVDSCHESERTVKSGLASWQNQYHTQAQEIAKAEQRLETAQQTYEALAESDQCPTCGEFISEKNIKSHKHEVKHLRVDLDELLAKQRATKDALDLAQDNYRTKQQQTDQALHSLEDHEAALKGARRDLARLEKDLDDMEDQHERLEKRVNPFQAIEERSQQERAELRRQLHSLQSDLDAAQGLYTLYSYWVRWFKEIRLELIGEALQQLEIEVNNQVVEKGLLNWELRFDIDRESKSGSITRGFSVTVLSPHNEKPVPWEAWSGGESQRLRLAAQEGLSNLIRARSGALLDLEVWDEPTQWLSPQGVQDLLESLESRAHREGRQIWIVDHRSLGFSGFKGQAGVVKTAKGSHFVQTGV